MKIKKLSLIIGLIILFIPVFVSAVSFKSPSEDQKLKDVIDGIANFIFIIGFILIPIAALYGAFLYITSGGNPEQLTQAKKIIIWAFVGAAILAVSKAILAVIWKILGGNIFGP